LGKKNRRLKKLSNLRLTRLNEYLTIRGIDKEVNWNETIERIR
jgi:hypothetical protein